MACEICTIRYVREGTVETVEVPAFGEQKRFCITQKNTLKCVIINPDWVQSGVEEVDEYKINYCPNCGRKLKGEE